MTKNNDKFRFILGWLITGGVFSVVAVGLLLWHQGREKSPEANPSPTISGVRSPVSPPSISNEDKKRFSSGERYLLLSEVDSNPNITTRALRLITQGTDSFESGNYKRAKEHFQKAVETAPNEPEAHIYFNNSLALEKGNTFKIAVVVPVDRNPNSAKEMLRGVADAQTEFNQEGLDNRLLEIVIVNDGNDPEISAKVAQIIADDPTFLGVIGHNSSNASSAALPLYEKAGLPMISPTSTSTKLVGDVFFRTVFSDKAAGRKLAEFLIRKEEVKRVAIFYDSKSSYSTSLKEAFENRFDGGDRFSQTIDLNAQNIDTKISTTIKNLEVEAAVLFPSTKTADIAIKVAAENARLPVQNRLLELLGGDTLYKSEILKQGGAALEGLILAVPWFRKNREGAYLPYAEKAKNRWKGDVSWRTAMSYDATKAFTETLSQSATRQTVLKQLKSVILSDSGTSGYPLQFDQQGERSGEVLLVEVAPGGQGFQFLE